MSNVLVVSGHPRTGDDSVANKTILEELTSLLPGAEIDHLDELYPDYVFDVEAEQACRGGRHRVAVSAVVVRLACAAAEVDGGRVRARFQPRVDGDGAAR